MINKLNKIIALAKKNVRTQSKKDAVINAIDTVLHSNDPIPGVDVIVEK